MVKKTAHLKTVGPVSAKLITALRSRGTSFFTLSDVQTILNKTKPQASGLISELTKRQIVYKLNNEIYLLLETAQEAAQLSNWPQIAKALASYNDYYLSHYSAMRLHGMTSHALSEIQITMPKRRRDKTIHHLNYHFIYLKQENFWGVEQKWVSRQEQVNVSDLERTLLDCLNKLDYCGGFTELVKGLWVIHNNIDYAKLIEYSAKYFNKAAVKRLGYILDSLNVAPSYVNKLQALIADAKFYVPLDPSSKNQGKYLKKWYLYVNTESINDYLKR